MKYFCVISHTHWDREWYMPFELFRLRLVDLIDRCLETLEKYPLFIFHLDAQTIVLEDYLEMRPDKKELLRTMIKERRLVVGPWYLQNDFYLTSGESTVRNLLEGTRIASDFGECGNVGYVPDQFGNISQLPQILNNFGIDSLIFGRGWGFPNRKMPTEFVWSGEDGSEVLAIHMAFWYNNAQRFSANIDTAKKLVDIVEASFEGVAMSPYLLLMNGVDHLEAQDDLLPILDEVQKRLPADKRIMQYHMDDYVQDLQEYFEANEVDLPEYVGELRNGSDGSILKGTLSSRSYLKTANVKAQNMLECKLEPVYSFMEMSGAAGVYSRDHFRYMWKQLMKNHPHDSICGCSRDEIHAHMEDSYARLGEVSGEMLNRGLTEMAHHMGLKEFSKENYVIIAANTVEAERSEAFRAVIDIPVDDGYQGISIWDNEGNPVAFDLISKERTKKDVFNALNLPGVLTVDRYTVSIRADKVAPLAVKGYIVKNAAPNELTPTIPCPNQVCMENERYQITVSENGTVSMLDKTTGYTVDNLLDLEETADRGQSYIYFGTDDPAIFGSAFDATVEWVENRAHRQVCRITREMEVPAYYDFDKVARADEKTVCKVALTLTLNAGNTPLEIGYEVNNTAKDHRIRLLVNTGLHPELSFADIPFDIVAHKDSDHWPDTTSKVLPNTSFAALQEDGKGVAVFTEGTHEYEHLAQNGTLAFTLVRSTGVINRNPDLSVTEGEYWHCPANQCLRTLEGRLGVSFYQGDCVAAGIPIESKAFRNPLIGYATSCDRKKFAGGRTAVQDTSLEEFFYLPDKYAAVKIPENHSFVTWDQTSVVMTALKKAENGAGIVIRLVNLSTEEVSAEIKVKGTIYETQMDEKSVCFLGDDKASYTFAPKQIVTLLVK